MAAADGAGHNSVIQLAPDHAGIAQYNKVRLIPFGEYSPAGFEWFTDSLNIPLKDLNACGVFLVLAWLSYRKRLMPV